MVAWLGVKLAAVMVERMVEKMEHWSAKPMVA